MDTIMVDKRKAIDHLDARGKALENLYQEADTVRKAHMGDEVYIRGIIEFSNICANDCLYCGIRASNANVNRYTMNPQEIVDLAQTMAGTAQTTVVLQSGETPGLSDEELGKVIRKIKQMGFAVTLSVGNRRREVYKYWQECGMDRYLLRFETSDPELFGRLRPGSALEERLVCLQYLKQLGVQTGSGFMIGLPGETVEVLAGNPRLYRYTGTW